MVLDFFDREIKIGDYVVMSGKTFVGAVQMKVGIVSNITDIGSVVCHVPCGTRTYTSYDSHNVVIVDKTLALDKFPGLAKYEGAKKRKSEHHGIKNDSV